MAIRARFKGEGGAYHTGIPARDLSEDDWEELTTEQRETARKSALYDVKSNREMEPRASAPKTPDKAPPKAPEPAADAANEGGN